MLQAVQDENTPQKSALPVAAAQRGAPTSQQIAHAGLLRTLGFTPKKVPAAGAAAATGGNQRVGQSFDEYIKNKDGYGESAFQYHPERMASATGYTGNLYIPGEVEITNESEGPRMVTTPTGGGLSPEYKAHLNKFQFANSNTSMDQKPTLAVHDSAGKLINKTFRVGDYNLRGDDPLMSFMHTVVPLLVGGGFGVGLAGLAGTAAGSAGSGAITGATSSGVNTAFEGGNFSDVLKSAAIGGAGGGMTAGLTNMGVNPMVSKALTGLTRSALTGQDPRTALLSSILGGSTSSPVANSLLKYLVAQRQVKKG